MTQMIDIILPVYRDLAATQRAIRAVVASENKTPWQLIIVNDASPEAEMAPLLASLCAQNDRIELLTNDENLGFVGSVNRAMQQHADRDVVLLNSDTIVHGDWLDRIVAHADAQTASITPFSNNATICSTPRIGDDNPKPADPPSYTAQMDAIHARINHAQSVDIPVGVGFCMWLNRAILTQIGLFDADAFGRGYGEECDWCLRASKHHYQHKLACDVFVYHEGGSSFGTESQELKANASQVIKRRYPSYDADIARWVVRDPARAYRQAAVAERYRSSGLPVILHITHQLGGGTQKHLRELCEHFDTRAHHLILMPDEKGAVRLTSAREEDGIEIISALPICQIPLQEALITFGVSRMHVHHLAGFNESHMRVLAQHLGVPMDITLHDYYLFSRLTYLCHPDGQPCDALEEEECARCDEKDDKTRFYWQKQFGWWLREAVRVIAPCEDVAARARRYQPEANVVVIPHLDKDTPAPEATYRALAQDEPMRIAIIGAMAWHKGAPRLCALAKQAAQMGMKLAIHHYGTVIDRTPPLRQSSVYFQSHGNYNESDLSTLLSQLDPHLIWFPGTCYETYSYTLSQAMKHGAPIWAPAMGALKERSAHYPATHLYDPQDSVAELAEQLLSLRQEWQSKSLPVPASSPAQYTYDTHYLIPLQAELPARAQGDTRLRVGFITHYREQPDACAVIRILQPLEHPALSSKASLISLKPHEVWHADIDVLLLARVTTCTPAMIDKLIAHAHSRNIPVIYDLDDDIPNLPISHPDYYYYQSLKPGIECWMQSADRVTLSTQMLSNAAAEHRSARQAPPMIIPNYLDERDWQLPDDKSLEERQTTSEKIKIVYVGTSTHQPDFAFIELKLRAMIQQHDASLTLIGVHSKTDAPHWCEVIEPPEEARISYGYFVRWLQEQQAQQGWQIGIAPLCDAPFNHAKSGIKYMEYSALGLAGIYADLPPYRDVVTHERTGLLTNASQPQAWADALDRLLSDKDFRLQTAQNALADVKQRHLLGADAELLSAVFLSALETPPDMNIAPCAQPAYRILANAHRLPQRRKPFKDMIRGLYYRHAAHPLVRFIWARCPQQFKQKLKQRIRSE